MIWVFVCAFVTTATAQQNDVVRIYDQQLTITIDNRRGDEYKDIIVFFGLNEDSLFHYGNIGQLAKDGWKLIKLNKHVAVIAKPLSSGTDQIMWGSQPIFFDNNNQTSELPGYPGLVNFGYNKFKSAPTVIQNANGEDVFFLPGHIDAMHVYLSGNFNNWSTGSTPMQKTDSGWIATLHLQAGKYFYKYIVDGEWIYDANNLQREYDGYGSYNSTWFHTNYSFRLNGYGNAKKVILTGSFNDWNEKELLMNNVAGVWEKEVYLRQGTYAYKFIVDGEWILDPLNPIARPDGSGNTNSFMAIGDTTYFELKGFTTARLVILSGTFNGWNTSELQMSRTPDGWSIPYVLGPGNYEYKFIVDGNWIPDPSNPYTIGYDELKNSVLALRANYAFKLNGFPNAKSVQLTGNFNNWADPGYQMLKTADGWLISLYLQPGKYIYKFIVDGEWILDPSNPQTEQNQFGTGNSVLWIEPQE